MHYINIICDALVFLAAYNVTLFCSVTHNTHLMFLYVDDSDKCTLLNVAKPISVNVEQSKTSRIPNTYLQH